ncbi:MAG: hypothetical protein IJK64_03465 [Clostridia bacterium]|nr:hypothetical protein [Clostridia bacterium]
MKLRYRLPALLCALLLVLGCCSAFAQEAPAAPEPDVDYTIKNPYDGVEFDSWKQYKTDLHSHTTFSDGHNTLPEMVERHYELGFDMVAITDHGTTSYGFTQQKHTTVMKLFSLVRNGFITDEVLSESGTAANGAAYTVTQENGDEYYQQTGGHSMMRVPFGVENNPTSYNNAHVCSWFVDYGHDVNGGTSNYERPIKAVDKLGGLSVINHPGEYTNARDEVYTADAYDESNLAYRYKINKFAGLLQKYPTCIGIDVNSKGDHRTRFDRKLWDLLLQKLAPHGRAVYAICSTDAHNLDIVNSGYVMAQLPEQSAAALQAGLGSGQFFGCSNYCGNVDELTAYRDEIAAINGVEANAFAQTLTETVTAIQAEIADGEQHTIWKAAEDAAPVRVNRVAVDEEADTITVTAENALTVHWIANGKVICVGDTIDLDDHGGEIGSYVRCEVFGPGGVVYVQPFLLDYDGAPAASPIESVDLGGIVSPIADAPVYFLILLLSLPLKYLLFPLIQK